MVDNLEVTSVVCVAHFIYTESHLDFTYSLEQQSILRVLIGIFEIYQIFNINTAQNSIQPMALWVIVVIVV